jgi:hypothetical protein
LHILADRFQDFRNHSVLIWECRGCERKLVLEPVRRAAKDRSQAAALH